MFDARLFRLKFIRILYPNEEIRRDIRKKQTACVIRSKAISTNLFCRVFMEISGALWIFSAFHRTNTWYFFPLITYSCERFARARRRRWWWFFSFEYIRHYHRSSSRSSIHKWRCDEVSCASCFAFKSSRWRSFTLAGQQDSGPRLRSSSLMCCIYFGLFLAASVRSFSTLHRYIYIYISADIRTCLLLQSREWHGKDFTWATLRTIELLHFSPTGISLFDIF